MDLGRGSRTYTRAHTMARHDSRTTAFCRRVVVCCANNGRTSRSASWPWLDKKYCLTARPPSNPDSPSMCSVQSEVTNYRTGSRAVVMLIACNLVGRVQRGSLCRNPENSLFLFLSFKKKELGLRGQIVNSMHRAWKSRRKRWIPWSILSDVISWIKIIIWV